VKQVYNACRRKLSSSERRAFSLVLAGVDRSISVLEVGCGRGGKLAWLHDLGFFDVLGVDVDRCSVERARAQGYKAMTVEELNAAGPNRSFGLLVFAHVIEHFAPLDLVPFMDGWLDRLVPGGLALMASPVEHPGFYLDFDHVKPYYPQGIMDFFGPEAAQTQLRSRHVLHMEDVRFKRGPLRLRQLRSLLLKKHDAPAHVLNLLLLFAFAGTAGWIGRTEGWIGLFRRAGLRAPKEGL
jgi:SAM-dependent methyltransferase